MRIGIIGAGNVGSTLGSRWAKLGHEVIYGVRSGREKALGELLAQSGPTARAACVAEAARASEVVLLATRWEATEQAIIDCESLAGKMVIDPTLPLFPDFSGLSAGASTSGGEIVAGWAAGARVVKAFNHMGANIMADPVFAGRPAPAFYCGDDAAAKTAVGSLISGLGFDAIDVGPLSMARHTEPLGFLWVTLALKLGYGREIAFDLLRR